MRNLRNARFDQWRQPDVTSACWDPSRDEILCTIGPTAENSAIQLLRVREDSKSISQTLVASWEAPSPNPDLPVDSVVDIYHLSGTATTCLVLEGGDIITVQENDLSPNGVHIEIMGSIDAGIQAARWSPDEELLTIVTKDHTVVFMGSSFDPVAETPMTADDLRASKHVSVGWGKKETQFQGRGAKALRDPTIPEKVDHGLPSPHEDGAASISWRGDGAFVAINSVQEGARRVIRVYSREGLLDSASEPVDGLESALSWRPSGNLIAGIRRGQDAIEVVFFERNGLRHGQFTLRSPNGALDSEQDKIRLEWNTDSTVLAVVFKDTVQLWTTSNYHWYLKREIATQACGPSSLRWHTEKALRFAVATPNGIILAEQIFYSARGSCRAPYDNGLVAVIDGDLVKMTPFRNANIPPPMSLYEVKAESSVVDIAFGKQNASFAILHHSGIDLYDMNSAQGRTTRPTLLRKLPFDTKNMPENHVPLRISNVSDGIFRCKSYQEDLGHLHLVINTAEEREGDDIRMLETNQLLVATSTYEDDAGAESYGQDQNGKIYRLSETGNELLDVGFSSQLPWFEISKAEGTTTAFGLSRGGHLYANTRLLAKNCTSFLVTPSHLIFTTSNHFVKYVHLAGEVEELEVPGDDPEKDERCRSVERGSRLVTAMPTNMSIVLQMPRGNLETIFPRAMVLAGIRRLIDDKDYKRAFAYCRTQRVDMNILCDYRLDQFLANEDERLAEKAVEHICFLVDVNRVYEHALGLYNLNLALLVAQQSQRDPREYLPFIQNLHTLTELRRKFEIDDHLARRDKALSHLHAMDAFDELCQYTSRHALHQESLRLYRYDEPRLRALTEIFAAHLQASSKNREAGLAYESIQNYSKATSCYRAAGAACWQECLFAAQQQQEPPLSPEARADLAAALADALWEAKDFSAAATVQLEYLGSLEAAVRCLCRGYRFAEAMRLVAQRAQPDLLEAAVDVGVAEALGRTTEFLADCKAQLAAQVPRIAELRLRAREDPLAFYEGERPGADDGLPDDVSVAASSRVTTGGASLFTRYTGKTGSIGTAGTGVSRATSKNRRREEKKRARGRKGTVYEEEYLVNSVRRLVERVNDARPDAERLVFALARRGMPERARAAEALAVDVLQACDRAVAEVFPPAPAAQQQQQQQQDAGDAAAAEAWRATGGEGVFQEFMQEQGKKSEPPVVSKLEKLALLG
ncbi:Elongator complex protein 1 [Escovopsis weberi]|uniref:Elongator complex protein 1 n=1 Tax=Escovopsis weberi TaxID=150374 RepID=A0A0M8MSV9_ESCWE|nr:Elongator complex protein 1 [Escovopsis weberi]